MCYIKKSVNNSYKTVVLKSCLGTCITLVKINFTLYIQRFLLRSKNNYNSVSPYRDNEK